MREEIYRVAARFGVEVFVVSNFSRPIRPPGLPNVRLIMVGEGFDAADDWIAEHVAAGDLCVTADIPLAARSLANGARVLSPSGRVWTADNIGAALAGRELSRHLRELGVVTRGPPAMTKADRSRFLSALDNELRQAMRAAQPARAPQ